MHPNQRPLRPSLLLLLAPLLLLSPARAAAQVPVLGPGPELERLEFLVGDWQGELTRYLPGGQKLVVRPAVETRWSLGEAWLESRDTTELPDGTVIHNRTWLTWNARLDSYVGAWQDNVMAGFIDFRARWLDPSRLELDTGDFQLAGRGHRVVFTYTRVSEDVFTVEMRQGWDGKEPQKVATGRFERRAIHNPPPPPP